MEEEEEVMVVLEEEEVVVEEEGCRIKPADAFDLAGHTRWHFLLVGVINQSKATLSALRDQVTAIKAAGNVQGMHGEPRRGKNIFLPLRPPTGRRHRKKEPCSRKAQHEHQRHVDASVGGIWSRRSILDGAVNNQMVGPSSLPRNK